MIRLFAHHLQDVWASQHGIENAEVRALTAASLNGRPSQPLIDPARDLTKVGFSWGPSDWIMPLDGPLPPRDQRWFDDIDDTLERVAATQPIAEPAASELATQ